MRSKTVSWVFVCQAGRIEKEACLLAASMRHHMGEDATLIAAIPMPETLLGKISADVVAFLDRLGVIRKPLTNEFASNPDAARDTAKLLMNKSYALELDRDAPISVFLDSDQICHAPFDYTNLTVPFVARRAFYPGAKATDGVWERAYQICDVEMPRHRMVARSRNHSDPVIACPPYFNSGFLSVHQPWVNKLAENYRSCYIRISEHNLLGADRYFEEQMALAIAVMKTGLPYELDNHRIDMRFRHYYSIARLASFEQHATLARNLAYNYSGLHDILAREADWRKLLCGVPVASRSIE